MDGTFGFLVVNIGMFIQELAERNFHEVGHIWTNGEAGTATLHYLAGGRKYKIEITTEVNDDAV